MSFDNYPVDIVNTPVLQRGEYATATPNDTRGPCPLVNTLANHGYISRDGRNVVLSELKEGLAAAGLTSVLAAVFSNPIFLEQNHHSAAITQPPRSFTSRLWYLLTHPWALLFSKFGVRPAGQTDSEGRDCLRLNQLAAHKVIEHDVSLTRHDIGQGDNITPQLDLIDNMIACSSDGEFLTVDDMARYRKIRLEQQKRANPECTYDKQAHTIGCTEIALVLNVLGDGQKVPCEYVRALFVEERLPIEEGWKARKECPLGLLELVKRSNEVKAAMGIDVK